ncbi:thiamine pyrophosphate-binding protein, partial [Stenotrophomonas sp. YIM B06876]|uniref:thiamine pyrophosphate-binding protein n=1 Tax=Stenotrophomonas sp. YIM B06876 TaxID=3060211 RepID=UPI0027397199
RSISKASYDLVDPSRVAEWTRRAIAKAVGGRPGPVVLNIPADIFAVEVDYPDHEFDLPGDMDVWPSRRLHASSEEVRQVAERLHAARRPVIWCGGGAIASGAWTEIVQLAELTGAAVATTYMGKGAIAENHALSVGTVGALGRPMTNEYVRSADLVLALGSRFTNLDTAGWSVPARTTEVIQVNIDADELGHHQPITMGVCADVRSFVTDLVAQCQPLQWDAAARADAVSGIRSKWLVERGTQSPQAAATGDGPVHPLQAIAALREAMSEEDTIVCDSGFNQIWGGQYFEVHRPGRSYIGPRGMGVMGFGLPGALGAAVADPGRKFVLLVGDGGFMMVIQELETARRMGIPVMVVVLNNGNLEYTKAGQTARYGSQTLSCDFAETDFAAIARAFDCEGLVVDQPEHLKSTFEQALRCKGPVVVDVRTVASAMPDGVKF